MIENKNAYKIIKIYDILYLNKKIKWRLEMKQNYLVFKNKNSLLSCILLAITVGIIMLGYLLLYLWNMIGIIGIKMIFCLEHIL